MSIFAVCVFRNEWWMLFIGYILMLSNSICYLQFICDISPMRNLPERTGGDLSVDQDRELFWLSFGCFRWRPSMGSFFNGLSGWTHHGSARGEGQGRTGWHLSKCSCHGDAIPGDQVRKVACRLLGTRAVMPISAHSASGCSECGAWDGGWGGRIYIGQGRSFDGVSDPIPDTAFHLGQLASIQEWNSPGAKESFFKPL